MKTQFDEQPEKLQLRSAILFGNPVQNNDEKILHSGRTVLLAVPCSKGKWSGYD